jgi:hypothetical protein
LAAVKLWAEFMNTQSDYLAAKPHRVYNVDEGRLSTQEERLLKVIISRNAGLKNTVQDKTYVSACVVPFCRADGTTPHVLYAIGKTHLSGNIGATLFDEPDDGTKIHHIFNSTGNVCTKSFAAMLHVFSHDWHVLNPRLRACVWMDNLPSHQSDLAILDATTKSVMCLCLPRCTTHLLQPLDQYPFGLLKKFLQAKRREDAIRKSLLGLGAKSTSDDAVLHALDYMKAWRAHGVLKASFEKCGLYPWSGDAILQSAKENVGEIKTPSVSAEAHKVASTLEELLTPKAAPRTMAVAVEKDVAYTGEQLVRMREQQQAKELAALEADVATKRVEASGTLRRSRECDNVGLLDDGLPAPEHDYWMRHCFCCGATRRSNSVIGAECESCDHVFLCGTCAGNRVARTIAFAHRAACG